MRRPIDVVDRGVRSRSAENIAIRMRVCTVPCPRVTAETQVHLEDEFGGSIPRRQTLHTVRPRSQMQDSPSRCNQPRQETPVVA